jgi:hypothetical protein
LGPRTEPRDRFRHGAESAADGFAFLGHYGAEFVHFGWPVRAPMAQFQQSVRNPRQPMRSQPPLFLRKCYHLKSHLTPC